MQYLISRFNKDGINRYKEIGFRLLFYNSYIKQIEKLIESSLQDIEKNELIPSESIAHKYATLQYSHYKDIYFESLIIAMYSFCETSLFSLCKVLEKDQKIKVSDFWGGRVFSNTSNIWKK
ncbi:hypothetical protein [Lacibacter cauensis]|uniref:hypothetical protein n=1 Tax=Lacibacter cauensis TaxID=510947 RepID=UPI0011A2C325|nr:hypothetical protein [Lacibacter cauensis]